MAARGWRTILAWGVVVALLASAPRGGRAAVDETTDRDLFNQAELAWRVVWERFFDARTNLFYDRLCSADPARRQAFLPTAQEAAQRFPNRNGWGTGMEDCAISAGVMMGLVCDRFDATRDASLRAAADKVFRGMVLLGTLSPAEGFIIRGVAPADGRSHYDETSRDQITWYAYGLWRYSRSPLSDAPQRAQARQIITALCQRLERQVVPANDFHFGREDGSSDGLVDKMWNVQAHEVARLPMIYAVGADLTGETPWQAAAERYLAEAAQQAAGDSTKIPYAWLQHQVSLATLYELEKSPSRKARWLECMKLVAGRTQNVFAYAARYRPLDITTLAMDWRTWPMVNSMGYQVPQMPQACRDEDRTVRQPAEAALTQFLLPDPQLTPQQLAQIRRALVQVDADKAVTYCLYYTLAAYWRGVRAGVFQTPR